MIIDNDGMCTLSDEDMSYHSGNYILPTNADRIRAMTDDELARFIAGQRAFWCNFEDPFDEEYPKVLEWLKQEVKT